MSGAGSVPLDTAMAPGGGRPVRGLWAGPALVALALVTFTLWVLVFVRTPAESLPLYFANRYFVLDATSMLFLLVINSVFLGISVYMSSRASTSRVLARHEISVQLAKVTTLGERVEDTFLISGPELQVNKRQIQIETELLETLEG